MLSSDLFSNDTVLSCPVQASDEGKRAQFIGEHEVSGLWGQRAPKHSVPPQHIVLNNDKLPLGNFTQFVTHVGHPRTEASGPIPP